MKLWINKDKLKDLTEIELLELLENDNINGTSRNAINMELIDRLDLPLGAKITKEFLKSRLNDSHKFRHK